MGKKVSGFAAVTTNSAEPLRLVSSISSMLHTKAAKGGWQRCHGLTPLVVERSSHSQHVCLAPLTPPILHCFPTALPRPTCRSPTPLPPPPRFLPHHPFFLSSLLPPLTRLAGVPAPVPVDGVDLRRLVQRGQRDDDLHPLQVKGGGGLVLNVDVGVAACRRGGEGGGGRGSRQQQRVKLLACSKLLLIAAAARFIFSLLKPE